MQRRAGLLRAAAVRSRRLERSQGVISRSLAIAAMASAFPSISTIKVRENAASAVCSSRLNSLLLFRSQPLECRGSSPSLILRRTAKQIGRFVVLDDTSICPSNPELIPSYVPHQPFTLTTWRNVWTVSMRSLWAAITALTSLYAAGLSSMTPVSLRHSMPAVAAT